MTEPDPEHPYSDTATAGDTVFVSGCLPLDEADRIVSDPAGAMDAALDGVGRRLRHAGLELTDVVKLTYYLLDIEDRALVNDQFIERFADPRPARTVIQVAGLPRGSRVEIDAVARIRR